MAAPCQVCSMPLQVARKIVIFRQLRNPAFYKNVQLYQCRRMCSVEGGLPDIKRPMPTTTQKAEKISKAMTAYLEKAQAHDEFMREQVEEFEIGKRHLANIMGVDPDNFTQEDIDKAVEYLMPSGLFEKKARPVMKHPEQVFPKKKAVQFGYDGRPFHYLFYTGKPNYYQIMNEAALKVEELKRHADSLTAKGVVEHDPHQQVTLSQSEYITKEELVEIVLEPLSQQDYERFTYLMSRLADLPYSARERGFVMQFRKPLVVQSLSQDLPPVQETESGRKFAESEGRRKTAYAWCRVTLDGSGKLMINDNDDISYFKSLLDREQLLFPLQLTGQLGRIDVEARVEGGGASGQAGALRLALSHALSPLVPADTVEKMRIAGLLTKDVRRKERKKPGQERARKKFTWKKR